MLVNTIFLVVFGMVFLHISSCRWLFREQFLKSPQVSLLKLILMMNLPLITAVGWISQSQASSLVEASLMVFYACLVFNSFAYAYFHFFNMSETARRIRMLIELRFKRRVKAEELERVYSPTDMVLFRLKRLQEAGQITKSGDDRYRISNHFLLGVALVFRWWRQLLGFI